MIMIIANHKSNLLDSLIYLMSQEKYEYCLESHLNDINKDITAVICIDCKNDEIEKQLTNISIPVIFISDEKRKIKTNGKVNYVVTNLLNDEDNYTDTQKEYLFKKGIYSNIINYINKFLNNDDNIDGLVIDTTLIKNIPNNWTFKFDSILETYNWISNKNKSGKKDFIKKEINFYNDKVYNDSSKEINYLMDKIMRIKDGMNMIDIFICTKDELNKYKNNYFFKSLLKNINSNYNMYYVNKEKLKNNEPDLLDKLLDGILIYEDCVYKDNYNDEYSLGTVNCNTNVVLEYNKYFDYILDRYGLKLNSDGDIDGI